MLKFRQANLTQKRPNVSFNELQLIALIEKGLSDNSLRGYLHKRSSPGAKWRLKWFLLFENLLFYFDFGANQTNQQPMESKIRAGGGSGKSSGSSAALSSLIRRPTKQSKVEEALSAAGLGEQRRAGKLLESVGGALPARRASDGDGGGPDADQADGCSRAASGESAASMRERLCSEPRAGGELVAGRGKGEPLSQRKTLNSSSISGVSNHFLAHNEQTVGRSTTAAGKTAGAGSSYASLLASRKIGLIFLEGSYCERLADQTGSLAGLKLAGHNGGAGADEPESELNCIFTLKWRQSGSKEYQFRCESEPECRTWVRAIASARYSVLLSDKEQLEQKYLHLSQIIESESTAKWQYSRQCEELNAEIKKLRQEVCLLRRQEGRSAQLRLALTKSAQLVQSLVQHQQQQQQQQRRHPPRPATRRSPLGVAVREADEREEPAPRPAPPEPASLARARSMEQEQAEQELAVRRSSRCSPVAPAGRNRRQARPLAEEAALGRRMRSLDAGARPASDELASEQLSLELNSVVAALSSSLLHADCPALLLTTDRQEELAKIRKVQGFFRGWLCRRRWKQIVQEYIKSPHAESMRKRNNLVFRMVECEEEYVEQLSLLISAFLRPIKMAASSQRPPLTHDELNSIFLNSETLLFLHQIFLKGLAARMESWPTLVLADLFNMLLPMLTIYQEFVRNHHFSLQVLAECKQRDQFATILRRLEEKPQLNGRTLETFLTYPMHQIPRYIICLHEILAHTPHNHVERKSLQEAQTKLEELSRQMHDEVSETENIRQNLAIERMIIGGCDILLDVNQVFVRQGILLQAAPALGKQAKAARRGQQQQQQQQQQLRQIQLQGGGEDLAETRQCFLFTNHLLLCTRTKDGKLHLLESIGRVALAEATLIENPLEFVQPASSSGRPSSVCKQANTNSSCNSISDCADGDTGAQYLDTDKRASSASVPARWGPARRPADQEEAPEGAEPSKSARARLAGYLATKLSGLAGLSGGGGGGGGGHSAGACSSSSAPPSPLHPRPAGAQLFGWPRRAGATAGSGRDFAGCDFILLLEPAGQHQGPLLLHLVAPNLQEKAAWMSDISQCIDNVHFNDLLHGSVADSASGTINQSVRTDPRLYKDDVDIKFSRALNSCKLPQIRYASIVRLFERLTDLRFLSIDFLNTFLLTYRVFTSAEEVLEALKGVHYNCDRYLHQQGLRELAEAAALSGQPSAAEGAEPATPKPAEEPAPPRLLAAPGAQKRRSTISALTPIAGSSSSSLAAPGANQLQPGAPPATADRARSSSINCPRPAPPDIRLQVPASRRALSGEKAELARRAPSSLDSADAPSSVPTSPSGSSSSGSRRRPRPRANLKGIDLAQARPQDCDTSADEDDKLLTSTDSAGSDADEGAVPAGGGQPAAAASLQLLAKLGQVRLAGPERVASDSDLEGAGRRPAPAPIATARPPPAAPELACKPPVQGRPPPPPSSSAATPRSSFQHHSSDLALERASRAGVVVSSSAPRVSSRRSSTASSASAFAAATAASNNPLLTGAVGCRAAAAAAEPPELLQCGCPPGANPKRRHLAGCVYCPAPSEGSSLCNSRASSRLSSCAGLELGGAGAGPLAPATRARPPSRPPSVGRSPRNSAQINIRSVATIRVLSVLRHWVSKHAQDFVNDPKLTCLVQEFLQDLIADQSLLPAEHKAAVQLEQMVQKAAHSREKRVDLDQLLAKPAKPSPDSIETLSALEIAEGMTYLDHRIFLAIRSEEFLGQAWMKLDKAQRAPHILLITKRFNDVSRLVSSEIIRVSDLQRRVAVIEKWTNVAHICRVVHNFNGVLQICAAFTNSAVFRLKKTWDKIPKTTRATIDQLQNLVSTDSRFRNMRDAINRCDPPSIPYVGMYLTDLSFIEEGTPNYSPDGLLNFSKMRMIAHVIREIQHLQNGSYKIELNKKVACYLLDSSRHLQDDEMYRCSLAIEPRSSAAKNGVPALAAAPPPPTRPE